VTGYRRYAAVVLVTLLVSANSAFAADEKNGLREVSNNVYSFTLGEGNHSMFVVGEDGVAVFETFNSRHSAAAALPTSRFNTRFIAITIGTMPVAGRCLRTQVQKQ